MKPVGESSERPPLNKGIRRELEQHLEQWLAAAEAQTAQVKVLPGTERCSCGVEVGLPTANCSVRVVEGACPLQGTGPVLAEAGKGLPLLTLCLRCPLEDGSVCALQLGFSKGAPALSDAANYAYLATPLLLWAKGLVEKETIEERFRGELSQAITAQDEEREWIALEVHDRIAQTLASVFQQLQVLEGMDRSYPEVHQAAVKGSLLCREAIREARNIMNDLCPPVLDELGLVPAMEDELSHLAEDTSCSVMQALFLRDRPPRTMELTLYRIFREAVVNIRRHAGAKAVKLSLRQESEGVRLEVSDNGAGFNVVETVQKKRVGGLLSMRRRAELAGGTWQLQSQPGKGTKLSVWLPLLPQNEAVE